MHTAAAQTNSTVFTLGHSNHPLEAFLDLVRQHRIELVVDVRSSPYSRYASHFNHDSIANHLEALGVGYLFAGDSLGGMPPGDEFYDAAGHVLYDRIAALATFQEALDKLTDSIGGGRVALVCGEEDPTNCHRRLLLGRVLMERGIAVLHIRGDGRIESEEQLAEEEAFRRTKGQKTLFDMEEPKEWKSTQSVSPERARRSSSEYCDGGPSGD